MRRIGSIFIFTIITLMAGTIAAAQQGGKPLTNQDVIAMVQNQLPESLILSAIKTNHSDFDISANGLIALKKAGVTAKIMEAMLASANNKKTGASARAAAPLSSGPAQPSGGAASAGSVALTASAPSSVGAPANTGPAGQPTVWAVQGGTKVNLTAEPTQIVHTKSKLTSLSALAADHAVNEALNLGTQAAQQALMKSGSVIGSSALISGTKIVSVFGNRPKQAKVTYVWALTGGSATSAVEGNSQTFEVNYAGIPGVNSEQFEPVIVKLSPTPQANFRLVGATEATTNAEQSTQQDWPVYSSFVENRIASKVQKLGLGHAQITPAVSMGPGEYAIAFRPVDKSKNFAGEDVGKNQGEGLLFNYAWPFSVK